MIYRIKLYSNDSDSFYNRSHFLGWEWKDLECAKRSLSAIKEFNQMRIDYDVLESKYDKEAVLQVFSTHRNRWWYIDNYTNRPKELKLKLDGHKDHRLLAYWGTLVGARIIEEKEGMSFFV